MKKLRDKILEIVKIVQECPENLQQICFEILLKHAISGGEAQNTAQQSDQKGNGATEKKDPKSVIDQAAKTQDDLLVSDLHVKIKKFLDKQQLTIEQLGQLFYKEEDQILPLYDDLLTTRTSESQIRITLLQCLQNAIQTGNFQTTVEHVKEESTIRKCYDMNNWSNNYSNNAKLFDFDKYSRKVQIITLSNDGKKELANLIKEML